MENNEKIEAKNMIEVFAFSNEEISLSLFNYLVEYDEGEINYTFNEETGVYHIFCEEDYKSEITNQILVYFSDNPPADLLPAEALSLSEILENIVKTNISNIPESKAYVSAEDKYNDVKSSASSLLIVGSIGIIVLALELLGVFSFPMIGVSRTLFFVTMTFIFVVFIILGIVSYRKAKTISGNIEKEENLEEKIVDYITDELDLLPIEDSFEESTPNEVKCIARSEFITSKVLEKFPEASNAFVEHIVEGLYEDLYESESSN